MFCLLLRLYRERENGGVAPEYPSIEVDRIETLVDQLIRSAVDSNYKR